MKSKSKTNRKAKFKPKPKANAKANAAKNGNGRQCPAALAGAGVLIILHHPENKSENKPARASKEEVESNDNEATRGTTSVVASDPQVQYDSAPATGDVDKVEQRLAETENVSGTETRLLGAEQLETPEPDAVNGAGDQPATASPPPVEPGSLPVEEAVPLAAEEDFVSLVGSTAGGAAIAGALPGNCGADGGTALAESIARLLGDAVRKADDATELPDLAPGAVNLETPTATPHDGKNQDAPDRGEDEGGDGAISDEADPLPTLGNPDASPDEEKALTINLPITPTIPETGDLSATLQASKPADTVAETAEGAATGAEYLTALTDPAGHAGSPDKAGNDEAEIPVVGLAGANSDSVEVVVHDPAEEEAPLTNDDAARPNEPQTTMPPNGDAFAGDGIEPSLPVLPNETRNVVIAEALIDGRGDFGLGATPAVPEIPPRGVDESAKANRHEGDSAGESISEHHEEKPDTQTTDIRITAEPHADVGAGGAAIGTQGGNKPDESEPPPKPPRKPRTPPPTIILPPEAERPAILVDQTVRLFRILDDLNKHPQTLAPGRRRENAMRNARNGLFPDRFDRQMAEAVRDYYSKQDPVFGDLIEKVGTGLALLQGNAPELAKEFADIVLHYPWGPPPFIRGKLRRYRWVDAVAEVLA